MQEIKNTLMINLPEIAEQSLGFPNALKKEKKALKENFISLYLH